MTAQALIAGFGGLVLGILLTALFARRPSKTPPKINSTHEVELAALAQALKEANLAVESAQKTKSAFLAKMSHELRTPMNAIMGFNDLLQSSQAANSKAMEVLQLTQQSGEHLLTVINDVLDYSQFQSGKLGIHPEPFELRKTVAHAMDLFANRIKNQQLFVSKLLLFQKDQQPVHRNVPNVRYLLVAVATVWVPIL